MRSGIISPYTLRRDSSVSEVSVNALLCRMFLYITLLQFRLVRISTNTKKIADCEKSPQNNLLFALSS